MVLSKSLIVFLRPATKSSTFQCLRFSTDALSRREASTQTSTHPSFRAAAAKRRTDARTRKLRGDEPKSITARNERRPQSRTPLSPSEPVPSFTPTSPQRANPALSTRNPKADSAAPSTQPTISAPFTVPRVPTGPKQKLPYHVSRSPTNNLPVYTDLKAGKTLKQTLIRKITGNAHALMTEIVRELELDPEKVAVGKVTGHLVIKGHCKPQVEQFLVSKGF